MQEYEHNKDTWITWYLRKTRLRPCLRVLKSKVTFSKIKCPSKVTNWLRRMLLIVIIEGMLFFLRGTCHMHRLRLSAIIPNIRFTKVCLMLSVRPSLFPRQICHRVLRQMLKILKIYWLVRRLSTSNSKRFRKICQQTLIRFRRLRTKR